MCRQLSCSVRGPEVRTMMCVLLTATSVTLLRGGSWIGVSAIADSYDFRSYNTDLTKTKQQVELHQEKKYQIIISCCFQFYSLKYNRMSCYLTTWSRVLLQKFTVSKLVMMYPTFHGLQRFITTHHNPQQFHMQRHTNPVHALLPYFLKIHFNIILTHMCTVVSSLYVFQSNSLWSYQS